jgi:predicted amidophosphoribosyltransferase
MIIENKACAGHVANPECRLCGGDETPGYWCEVCGQEVAEKRCPLCGLKARRIRTDVGKQPKGTKP